MKMRERIEHEIANWGAVGPQAVGPTILPKLLLAHGEEWKLDCEAQHGGEQMKMCFMNAAHIAQQEGLYYVEGLAVRPKIGLLMHHAWVADPVTKLAFDPTWDNPNSAKWGKALYWGIAFDADEAMQQMIEQNVYGLLDIGDPHCRAFMERRWPGTFPSLKAAS